MSVPRSAFLIPRSRFGPLHSVFSVHRSAFPKAPDYTLRLGGRRRVGLDRKRKPSAGVAPPVVDLARRLAES